MEEEKQIYQNIMNSFAAKREVERLRNMKLLRSQVINLIHQVNKYMQEFALSFDEIDLRNENDAKNIKVRNAFHGEMVFRKSLIFNLPLCRMENYFHWGMKISFLRDRLVPLEDELKIIDLDANILKTDQSDQFFHSSNKETLEFLGRYEDGNIKFDTVTRQFYTKEAPFGFYGVLGWIDQAPHYTKEVIVAFDAKTQEGEKE